MHLARRTTLLAVFLSFLSSIAAPSARAATPELAVSNADPAQLAARTSPLPCQMPWRLHWTPEQVLADRIAALQAGDIDRAMCSYAPDAVLIMPGVVLHGRDEIRGGLEQMYAMFGAQLPGTYTITGEGQVWQLAFSLLGPIVSIPDGSDTYVIKHGFIFFQTVHDPIVFSQPPSSPTP